MSYLNLIFNVRPVNTYVDLKNMPYMEAASLKSLRDVVGHMMRPLKLPDFRPSKYLLGVNRGQHYKKQSPQPSVAPAASAAKGKAPASQVGGILKKIVAALFSPSPSSPYRPMMLGQTPPKKKKYYEYEL